LVVELIGILSRLVASRVRGFDEHTTKTPGSLAAVRALRTGGPLYAGNTLYIDSPAHHLSVRAQILRDGLAVLVARDLSDSRNVDGSRARARGARRAVVI
jgi:hypothetical protein